MNPDLLDANEELAVGRCGWLLPDDWQIQEIELYSWLFVASYRSLMAPHLVPTVLWTCEFGKFA